MKKIVLVGGGGHCKSVIDSIRSKNEFEIVGITDPVDKGEILNVKILGTDYILQDMHNQGVEYAFITVGSIGNPKLRITLYDMLSKIGFKFPAIIDKTAIVSEECSIGEGTFVGKGAIVNAEAIIGKQAIINTGAIVEHDCLVGDFVHIAPGATLSGGVTIEKYCHVGTNATIIEGISVVKSTVIGAGSVVINSIDKASKVYGNPARGKEYE